jgi:hypothetical protein
MARPDFLKQLHSSCQQLERSFPKTERKWLTALISRTVQNRGLNADRIYELMCCFALISSLRSRVQNLRVIPAPGTQGMRLPYAPGKKQNFAFFRFEKEGQTYDLCCGVKIPVPGEPSEAPDISLQHKGSGAPDSDRSSGVPIALWDAKYHKRVGSKSDLQQMNWWCDLFNLPKCVPGDILSNVMPPAFQVSAVITNVGPMRTNKTLLLRKRFSILFNFVGNPIGMCPSPSRAEHESQP